MELEFHHIILGYDVRHLVEDLKEQFKRQKSKNYLHLMKKLNILKEILIISIINLSLHIKFAGHWARTLTYISLT